jgi:hypothetical protein
MILPPENGITIYTLAEFPVECSQLLGVSRSTYTPGLFYYIYIYIYARIVEYIFVVHNFMYHVQIGITGVEEMHGSAARPSMR